MHLIRVLQLIEDQKSVGRKWILFLLKRLQNKWHIEMSVFGKRTGN